MAKILINLLIKIKENCLNNCENHTTVLIKSQQWIINWMVHRVNRCALFSCNTVYNSNNKQYYINISEREDEEDWINQQKKIFAR